MKGILGIDPGLTGGLAILKPEGVIVEAMPVAGSELDIADLSRWLKAHKEDIEVAYIEQVHAFQGASGSSMLKFGRVVGALEGVLTAVGIKYQAVRPGVWCKVIHQGMDKDMKPKDKSRLAASRLFPSVDLRATERSKVPHEGMMDALLIAEYGRRQTVNL